MKKISALALFLSLAFLLSTTIAKATAYEKKTIFISTPTATHGWTLGVTWWAKKAVKDFNEKYPNIKVIYKESASVQVQINDINIMLKNGMDALVILPHRPVSLSTVLKNVANKNVFLVTVDRSSTRDYKDINVTGDNYIFGFLSGQYIANKLAGKGSLVVFEGVSGQSNTLRIKGFKDAIRHFPDIFILDSLPAFWNPAKGYELMHVYLEKFPKIDAVWVGDDDVQELVLKAYQESGRKDIKIFFGGGGSKKTMERIINKDTLVTATVHYSPKMIYDATLIAIEKIIFNKTFPQEVFIPSVLITGTNVKEYYIQDSIY